MYRLAVGLVFVLGVSASGLAQPCGQTNLALRKPVTASSTWLNCVPSNAFDGSVRTGWNAGTSGTSWIEVDLGGVQPVGQVWLDVGQKPGHLLERILEVSRDGSTYATVVHTNEFTFDSQKLIYDIPAQTSARYVRVTNKSTNSWNAYYEIGVYGPPNLPIPVATLGGGANGCGGPPSMLMRIRISGRTGKPCFLAATLQTVSCAPVRLPPLQGSFHFASVPWALIAAARLDSMGQAVFPIPISGIPTGITFTLQGAVLDAQTPANGGFTNLHVVRF